MSPSELLARYLVDLAKLSLWLGLLAILFVPLERWFALADRTVDRRTRAIDVGFYFLNSLLPAAVLSLLMSVVVLAGQSVIPHGYYEWTAGLPLLVTLPVALVVSEIGFYWGHRWAHEVPFLWQFHEAHHRPDHIRWLVNTRGHPIDMIFVRLCGLTPLYLLGIARFADPQGNVVASLAIIIGTVWGFFIHANVKWRLRWLEPVVATPFFHHWHHTRDGAINRNYAAMFPIVDRAFGTYHAPDGWPERYGVTEVPAADARPSGRTPPSREPRRQPS